MGFEVKFYRPTYDAVQKRLDEMGKGGAVNDVMLKAIKETAVWTKNATYAATKQMYTIKAGSFRKSDIRLKQATKRHLEAHLTVRGGPLSLRKAYGNRKNSKKVAAKAMVKKDGGLKELEMQSGGRSYKAFVATMKSGHEGIFQRVPGEYMKKYPHTSYMKGREKIKEFFSLAKSKAVENAYNESIAPDVQSELFSRIHRHMNAVIGGS